MKWLKRKKIEFSKRAKVEVRTWKCLSLRFTSRTGNALTSNKSPVLWSIPWIVSVLSPKHSSFCSFQAFWHDSRKVSANSTASKHCLRMTVVARCLETVYLHEMSRANWPGRLSSAAPSTGKRNTHNWTKNLADRLTNRCLWLREFGSKNPKWLSQKSRPPSSICVWCCKQWNKNRKFTCFRNDKIEWKLNCVIARTVPHSSIVVKSMIFSAHVGYNSSVSRFVNSNSLHILYSFISLVFFVVNAKRIESLTPHKHTYLRLYVTDA